MLKRQYKLTIFNSSGPLTEMKLIPASLAMALASNVFPQPGGPHNNTPVGAVKPNALKYSGYLTGAYDKQIYLIYAR